MVKRKAAEDEQEQDPGEVSESPTGKPETEAGDTSTGDENLDDYPGEEEQNPVPDQSSASPEIVVVDANLQPDEYNAPGQEIEATLKKYNEESAQ